MNARQTRRQAVETGTNPDRAALCDGMSIIWASIKKQGPRLDTIHHPTSITFDVAIELVCAELARHGYGGIYVQILVGGPHDHPTDIQVVIDGKHVATGLITTQNRVLGEM